jgi:hypothetical protein
MVLFLFGSDLDVKSQMRQERDRRVSSVEKKHKTNVKSASSSSKPAKGSEDLNSLFRPDIALVRSTKRHDSSSVRQTLSAPSQTMALEEMSVSNRKTILAIGSSAKKLHNNLHKRCDRDGATSMKSRSKHSRQIKGSGLATKAMNHSNILKNVKCENSSIGKTPTSVDKSASADDDAKLNNLIRVFFIARHLTYNLLTGSIMCGIK